MYVDVGSLLKNNPVERVMLAGLLLFVLRQRYSGSFTRVVGADTSSTALAKDVAKIAVVDHIRMVKTPAGDGSNQQVWHPDNKPLEDGDVILHIEELVTTSSSAKLVRGGIDLANPGAKYGFVPFLPVIVDRSDPNNRLTSVGESVVLPLLQLDMQSYAAEDCPYCKVGSEAIKPKEGDNWSRLTAK